MKNEGDIFSPHRYALIQFTDKPIHQTKEISQNFYIDIDKTGHLVSITVEHTKYSAGLRKFSVQEMSCEKHRTAVPLKFFSIV